MAHVSSVPYVSVFVKLTKGPQGHVPKTVREQWGGKFRI